MGQFTEGIRRYRLKCEQLTLEGFRKVVLDVDRKVVERTPVDSGRARGNWQSNIGEQAQAIATEDTSDPIPGIEAMLPQLKLGDRAWMSNALPYIPVLEYGGFPNPPKHGTGKTIGGFSTQAPQGMVRVTAAEFGAIVEGVK